MTEHDERALDEFLNKYWKQLDRHSKFYTDIDWNTLSTIANEPNIDLLKVKVDKFFDDKVFTICLDKPNVDSGTFAIHLSDIAFDLNAEVDSIFADLNLTPLIPVQYTDPDLRKSFEKDVPQISIPTPRREHRPSLDLIQTRSSPHTAIESYSGKPTQPTISNVNAMANPLTMPIASVIPSERNAPQNLTKTSDQPTVSPQKLTSPAKLKSVGVRRGSSVDANLPLYIRQQILSPRVASSAEPRKVGLELASRSNDLGPSSSKPPPSPTEHQPSSDRYELLSKDRDVYSGKAEPLDRASGPCFFKNKPEPSFKDSGPLPNIPGPSSNERAAQSLASPRHVTTHVNALATELTDLVNVGPTPPQNHFLISSRSLKVFANDSSQGSMLPAGLQYTRQTIDSANTDDYLSTEILESNSLSRLGDSNGGPSNSDYSRY